MSSSANTAKFRWHGAFCDASLEEAYWKDTWEEWSKVSIYSASILGIVLIGLVLPQLDLQILGYSREFLQLLALRLSVAGLFLWVIVAASKAEAQQNIVHVRTSLALFATAGMMVVAVHYHTAAEFIPILAHVIPPLVTFLIIPNRPQWKLIVGLVFAIGFFYSMSTDLVAETAAPRSFLLSSYVLINLAGMTASARRERTSRQRYITQSQAKKTRDEALEALRLSKVEVQNILENLEDTFFRTDPNGILTFVSPSVEKLVGMPREEVLGQDVNAFLYDSGYIATAKQMLRAEGGHLRNFRSRLKTSYTDARWVETSAGLRFDEHGKLLGFEGTARDISDLVKAEDMLRHSQKMEAIGHLTGGVAHDFNNLLAVVSGNVELLWGTTKEQRDSVRPILDAVGRGKELTQRLLAFARQQPLQPEPTNIGQQVLETKTLLARTLGAKFRVDLETDTDLWPAMVDSGQFENTLINLLINARDAMPEGGRIAISCRNAHLTDGGRPNFTDLANGDYVILSVADCGEGMTADTVEHAFEPFFSTKETGRGSGLGLSMVYGFVRQSGGDIFIDSTIDVGTTLSLYFPRSQLPAVEKPKTGYQVSSQGRGRNILVIEDEPAVREITLRMLAILGYNATAACDAPEALSILSQETDFALILSDVVLPGKMNGPDIAKELRKKGRSETFIFMSGYLADAITDPAFIDGETPFLAKPFKLSELEIALQEVLARSKSAPSFDIRVSN